MGAKTVLVTGGGRRLGAATVTALVEAGWTALVHVRTATEEAESLLAALAEVIWSRSGPSHGRD